MQEVMNMLKGLADSLHTKRLRFAVEQNVQATGIYLGILIYILLSASNLSRGLTLLKN